MKLYGWDVYWCIVGIVGFAHLVIGIRMIFCFNLIPFQESLCQASDIAKLGVLKIL
jgi:hypothetical protein